MNRQIISNGFLLLTRRAAYLAKSICGALILDLFDYILSNREISWLPISYQEIKIELNDEFSTKTIQRSIQYLEEKKLIISQVFKNKQKKYTLNYEAINSLEVPCKQVRGQNVQPPEDKMSSDELVTGQNVQPPEDKMSPSRGQNVPSDLIYKIQNTSFNTEPEQKNKKEVLSQEGNSSALNLGVVAVSDLISSEIKSTNLDSQNKSTSLTEKNQGLMVKATNSGKDQLSPQVDFSDNQGNKTTDNCSLITDNCKRVDPFFGQKRNQSNFGEWIPDGPWLKISDTGRRHLDNAFVEYRAKKFFVKNWGDDLPEAVSKTIKYYRNDIERLAIDWEEYNATALVTAANIQAYTKSTGEVKQSDVEKLESIKSAFQVLPAEVRSTDKVIEFKPVVAQTVPQYQEIRELSAENPKTINNTYRAIEAPNTAQEYRTTVTIENEATPEQKAEFFKAFKQMFSGKSNRSMSTVKDQQEKTKIPKTHLDVLNEQLCDPICRPSVMREVMNSEKYQFSYNELTGEPQSVVLIADAV